ncbi:CopG family ribbon-helix-helix protein [Natronomonas marina]|uniref:CopG family ribbon-helix-helix protein n=1 Tax=Natronomonas marina TaxID=2961939 RepID=UPI0020C99005|nr:ribbon-helix-helix domain-containing protein [Natronomonas marina]
MSTDIVSQADPREERTTIRVSTRTAAKLTDEFYTTSEGLRAAMRYCIAEAPLSEWPVPEQPVGADIRADSTRRVTVRVDQERLERLEAVVDRHNVPSPSRAVRDALREMLAGDLR